MERALAIASRQATDAIRAEERAAEKLRLAQQELAEARAKNHATQKVRFEAVQAEKDAMMGANKSSEKLREQTEAVRYYLRQNEDQSMERETISLQIKKQRIEESAAEVKRKAQEIKKKADELRWKAKQEERDARN